jgi:hypothetical protein
MVGTRQVGGRLRWRISFAFYALVVVGFIVPACGGQSVGDEEPPPPSCVELCEKGKREKCPGTEGLMCEENCLGDDLLTEESGCRSESNAALHCTAELEDICSVREECKDEILAVTNCYREFCKDSSYVLCVAFR